MDSNCKSGRCGPRRPSPPSPQKQQEQVNEWNALHTAGDAVIVLKDDGSVLRTVTRSDAWLMGGHSAVVLVDGIPGAYMLSRVSAVRN